MGFLQAKKISLDGGGNTAARGSGGSDFGHDQRASDLIDPNAVDTA
jgi:hypothetical protein